MFVFAGDVKLSDLVKEGEKFVSGHHMVLLATYRGST